MLRERGEVRPKPLEVEPGAAVEHHDGVAAVPLEPVKELHAVRPDEVARTRPRHFSLTHSSRRRVRGRAGAQQKTPGPQLALIVLQVCKAVPSVHH